jgi:large subunit ribosomal protein L27Ae
VREQATGRKASQEVPVIDCIANGFFKVTGRGELPKVPFIVRAKEFTEGAEKKIKAAGGACEKVSGNK